jgi:hypothetical protein
MPFLDCPAGELDWAMVVTGSPGYSMSIVVGDTGLLSLNNAVVSGINWNII